ncbi:hypothetical protein amb0670 [Paramagnetospirillum magneticum AMB-1]|uniref:Uncharacterized protein n=1 Tax=Paramagnetospirillum magneticum (strain ATCC 700264 / AMB-1) TaxID=342108 RepID=Q2W9K1_PARM1|nr:hypothetical protein amb0670 [Paramagnetospirillum magneticum AMB-1]
MIMVLGCSLLNRRACMMPSTCSKIFSTTQMLFLVSWALMNMSPTCASTDLRLNIPTPAEFTLDEMIILPRPKAARPD